MLSQVITIQSLPGALHDNIALSLPDIDDRLATRAAAPEMGDAAARSVKRLRAENAVLPQESWDTFPNADGVVVTIESNCDIQHLAELVSTLPARTRSITVISAFDDHYFSGDLAPFVQAVLSSPCAKNLVQLHCAFTDMPVDCADQLARGLPLIEDLSLWVTNEAVYDARYDSYDYENDEPPTSRFTLAHFPASLRALSLQLVRVGLDLAPLTKCSSFRSLCVDPQEASLLNISSLQDCQALESVEVVGLQATHAQRAALLHACTTVPSIKVVKVGSKCSQPGEDLVATSSSTWRQLCQLPHLQHLEVYKLVIDSIQWPSHTIKHFQADRISAEGLSDADFKGCIKALLPAMQCLIITGAGVGSDILGHEQLPVLDQHEHMEVLRVDGAGAGSRQWSSLAGMPALLEVDLDYGLEPASGAQVLQDAAACERLESIKLSIHSSASSDSDALPDIPAAVRGLVSGRCAKQLREVMVAGDEECAQHVSVEDLAWLLRGLPALQRLRLPISIQYEKSLDHNTTTEVAGLLQQQMQDLGVAWVRQDVEHRVEWDMLLVTGLVGTCTVWCNVYRRV